MTAKHLSVGIIIFIAGTIFGTAQTWVVSNFPTEFQSPKPTIVAPIPQKDIVPTDTPTPTASPSATPTLTPRPVVRHYYYSPTPTPTL